MPLRRKLVKLLKDDPDIRLLGYSCFGQCDFGPNVAIYPPGTWYGGLSAPDDAERVVCHARSGLSTPLGEQLCLPADERELHLRNISELVRTHERDRARRPRSHWWWPF
jgi:(2Fe-2S) ferredoxin